MILFHLTNCQKRKICFCRQDKTAKTFSSNWKPFGFRSADAHTRARVRAGGGVEPAARSSHKPPDAQKEAAKKKKAKNCAKSSEERRNLCEEGKRRRSAPRVRSGAQPRSLRPDILLFCCFVGWSSRARGAGARLPKAPQLRRRPRRCRFRTRKGPDQPHLCRFCFSFRG